MKISKKYFNTIIIVAVLLALSIQRCLADELKQLNILKQAYPRYIKNITHDAIIWSEGKHMNIKDSSSPSLIQQLNQPTYPTNEMIHCETYIPKNDPGRIRNELFFSKMYGEKKNDVKHNLDTIYWMPKYFNHKYPLLITKINKVNIQLKRVSDQLELLVKKHPALIKYLENPSTFLWRDIENSKRKSPHSFGIAIDLNTPYSNYWIWDTGIKENNIGQTDIFSYKNQIPCEIVTIFENNGFIWGGKWQHYDTMHFEYRPELLLR